MLVDYFHKEKLLDDLLNWLTWIQQYVNIIDDNEKMFIPNDLGYIFLFFFHSRKSIFSIELVSIIAIF